MNITMAIRVAILESRAFSILPDFIVAEELAQGRLVRMLPDWTLRKGGVYTVTPPGHVRSHALRAFLTAAHKEMSGRRPGKPSVMQALGNLE